MKIFAWFLGLLAFAIILGVCFIFILTPEVNAVMSSLEMAIEGLTPNEYYDRHGVLIAKSQQQEYVPYEKIPADVWKPFVAIEDKRFFKHRGVDWIGLGRAIVKNLTSGRSAQGGSTITQQLVKNVLLTNAKTKWRKLVEILLACQVERMFSKEQILAAYMNQIPFGSGTIGIQAAGKMYFGKNAWDLTLAEASVLAGIPKRPARYNPQYSQDNARDRQFTVLRITAENGFISRSQWQAAKRAPLIYQKAPEKSKNYDAFISVVNGEISRSFGEDATKFGGLKINTTMDLDLQEALTDAVREVMAKVIDKFLGFTKPYEKASWAEKLNYPEATAVLLNPKDGTVLAMVGGRDAQRSDLNRAVMARLPGSVFKLFTYGAAAEANLITPATVVVDAETTFVIPHSAPWTPHNYERDFDGEKTIALSLAQSSNIPATKVAAKIGPEKITGLARRCDITSPLQNSLSVSIGTNAVRPDELAGAYAMLANGGVWRKSNYFSSISSNGKTLKTATYSSHRVLSEQDAYVLVSMFLNVIASQWGTGRGIGIDWPLAGKTGTSENYKDSWFVCFSPEFVLVIRVGFDQPKPMINPRTGKGLTGGGGALKIAKLFLEKIENKLQKTDFPKPPYIEERRFDEKTGVEVTEGGIKAAFKTK